MYSYNLEGRSASAIVNRTESASPVEQTNQYFYNQSGIRTRKEMAGRWNQTTVFLNDPQNLTGFSQVFEELPSVGAAPRVSYTLGSQVISQEKGGTNLYLMADGHGSTRLLTETNGAISDRYSFDAYGLPLKFQPGVLEPAEDGHPVCWRAVGCSVCSSIICGRVTTIRQSGRFGVRIKRTVLPKDPFEPAQVRLRQTTR